MLGTYEGNDNNHAYFKPIYTTTEAFEKFNIFANDGYLFTAWESKSQNNDTLVIDLGSSFTQNFIAIHWDNLSISSFEFQVSEDSLAWEKVFDETIGLASKMVYTSNEPFSGRYLRLVLANNDKTRTFKVNEVISEFVQNNQPPEVIKSIEDLTRDLSTVKNINNYIKFEEIFTDTEHPEYLTFQIYNSNDNLVRPQFSIGDLGVSLFFEKGQVGTSVVTVTAVDPFGASVSTSFNVVVDEDMLDVSEEESTVVIYPNPAEDILILDMSHHTKIPGQIAIYNSRGQLVDRFQNNKPVNSLHIGHYALGVYIIQFVSDDERSFGRFIKR